MTVGWFMRDRKLAMLQTPHHFYSPDPFERNLEQFRVIPNEGELPLFTRNMITDNGQ